jgi:hypothetical protein
MNKTIGDDHERAPDEYYHRPLVVVLKLPRTIDGCKATHKEDKRIAFLGVGFHGWFFAQQYRLAFKLTKTFPNVYCPTEQLVMQLGTSVVHAAAPKIGG